MIGRIADKELLGYSTVTELPSYYSVRACRARSNDLTYRHAEHKRVPNYLPSAKSMLQRCT